MSGEGIRKILNCKKKLCFFLPRQKTWEGATLNNCEVPPKGMIKPVTVKNKLLCSGWENSRDFITPSLHVASLQFNIWGMSAEIPGWWLVTTQMWVVLLIGSGKFLCCLTNLKHYPDLESDTRGSWWHSRYTFDSLNGHLYKTDTSVKRTLRVGPCLCLLPLFVSL